MSTFDKFRDPQPLIRRQYQGSKYNRIDKHLSSGSSFRVEGVTDHSLETDCYITESIELIRRKPIPDEPEEKVSCNTLDAYYNRALFRLPA